MAICPHFSLDSGILFCAWKPDSKLIPIPSVIRYLYLAVLVGVLPIAGCHSSEDLQMRNVTSIRVMSYNIRFNNRDDGENAWPNRKERLMALVRSYNPDVIGFQEALHGQVLELAEGMPEYDWVGVGRDDGKIGGEFSPVFFRRDRFDRMSFETRWLSESPRIPGSIGWDAAITRIASVLKVRDSHTDNEVMVVNTHFDHAGREAQRNSARMIRAWAAQLAENCPYLIVTGDFNIVPEREAYLFLTGPDSDVAPLFDTRIHTDNVAGPLETHFGFNVENRTGEKIDYIFTTEAFSVTRFETVDRNNGRSYPSDHLPIVADLEFR